MPIERATTKHIVDTFFFLSHRMMVLKKHFPQKIVGLWADAVDSELLLEM